MPNYQGHTQNQVNFITIEIANETVILESGALHYWQGNIEMETKAPSVGGLLKAVGTGENIFRPRYSGTGTIMIEPSFETFFTLNLDNQSYTLDSGAFVACDESIEIGAIRNKVLTGLRSGEGLFQTKVSGTGTVVAKAPGPVQVINLNNETLAVDGRFAVARDSDLELKVEKASKSLLASAASGEGFLNKISGTGQVYLAPVPNFATMMQRIITPYMVAQS
jgi:uncharacterized protein (AIM24 family)